MIPRLLALSFLFAFSLKPQAQTTAIYDITFESVWSQSTHPHSSGNLPSNAHWSALVGAVHNANITFFESGLLATEGVERIAESGANSVFFSEVNNAINQGNALTVLSGGQLNSSSGTVMLNDVTLTQEFPLVSLISMIAPSPDWVIMAPQVNLLSPENEWLSSVSIDLYPYDAGTDNGTDYTSANSDAQPPQPIASLQNMTPFSNQKIGTITFTLKTLNTDNFLGNTLKIYPNPVQHTVFISGISTKSEFSKIELYSSSGKLVLKTLTPKVSNNTISLLVDTLPQGLYFIKLFEGNNSPNTFQILKQ